jgi:Rieske Fe-S protein
MAELDDRTPTADSRTATPRGPHRRQVLLTGGMVAAAAAVTAACGSSSSSSEAPASSSGASTPAASSSAASPSAPAATGVQVATSDVPVGGGTVLEKEQVVVTQPTAGTFKAFTAVCTHQGCTVAGVANGTITCPCHNSTFSAADGSVTGGPAPSALAALPVTVSGTTISVQV